MTSASVYIILLCCLLINNQGLAFGFRNHQHDDAEDRLNLQLRGVTATPQPGSNTNNFNSAYGKDSYDVYWAGQKMSGVYVSSFKVLGGGYGKDSYDVYWAGQKVSGASATSFRNLGGGYGKDSYDVYYMGKKVQGASATSFITLNEN